MTESSRLKITLVQQGVWDTPLDSLPLAIAYLKAAAMEDARLRDRVDITLLSCRGGDSPARMAEQLFGAGTPDIIGFSVAGWNLRQFGALSETFGQLNPDGWNIWGGTHVAHQAERVMRLFPQVDVIANGEGEVPFPELLVARLQERSRTDLADIPGISYRGDSGAIVTTPAPPRIKDLDSIPSPFLTGAVDLTDAAGDFRFDVALMETSRGCPYRCSFCYWGGAIGQKMRQFSRERLKAEIELFGQLRVETLVLCDSNFGMRPADLEFLEDVIEVRDRCGFPRSIEASWAKNKSAVFYELVRRMTDVGLRSSFTLALQTLSDEPLQAMRRRNMPVNDWSSLVDWLQSQGLDCYAELIWGAPGETVESFLDGYDRLAAHVPRIATYPLLLLPNTEYAEERDRFGFVTVRGRSDDFEYVLAHNTMTIDDNRLMQRFLVWARVLGENMVFRHLWAPLRERADCTQSAVVLSLADWFDESSDPAAAALRAKDVQPGDPDAVPRMLRAVYSGAAVDRLLRDWWQTRMLDLIPPEHKAFLTDAFRLDMLTRPVVDGRAGALPSAPVRGGDGHTYFRRGPERFSRAAVAEFEVDLGAEAENGNASVELSAWCRAGYDGYLDNHEMVPLFLGRLSLDSELPPVDAALARA